MALSILRGFLYTTLVSIFDFTRRRSRSIPTQVCIFCRPPRIVSLSRSLYRKSYQWRHFYHRLTVLWFVRCFISLIVVVSDHIITSEPVVVELIVASSLAIIFSVWLYVCILFGLRHFTSLNTSPALWPLWRALGGVCWGSTSQNLSAFSSFG